MLGRGIWLFHVLFRCPRPLNRGVRLIKVSLKVNKGNKFWDFLYCPLYRLSIDLPNTVLKLLQASLFPFHFTSKLVFLSKILAAFPLLVKKRNTIHICFFRCWRGRYIGSDRSQTDQMVALVCDPGGYSHTLPIRVCAAQRGHDFEALDLERGIHFRGVF